MGEGRKTLQAAMTAHAGVLRSAESLAAARDAVAAWAVAPGDGADRGARELHNLATVAQALCRAATAREETRGAHSRRDFPQRSDDHQHRFVVRL